MHIRVAEPDDAAPSMTVVAAGNAHLHITQKGAGPVCLMLSAIGTAPYMAQTPRALSDRFRLVYVDLRGSGQSGGEASDLTFDLVAEDLEAVRTHLGLERVAVLGHSVLGALAIEYGRRCPTQVSHVVAVGTPTSGDMAATSSQAAAFFEQDASEERRRQLQDNLAALPAEPTRGQWLFAHTPMRYHDMTFDPAPLFAGAQVRPGALEHILGTMVSGWEAAGPARALGSRLWVAHGRHDYTVPYTLWSELMSTLPDATFELFERSGHQPFFEEPELFAASLASWMAP